jgi:replicative DNA helicase
MAREAARVAAGKGETFPVDVANVPHSVQAEQALLGAIMVNNRVFDDLEGALQPDHFYVPMHAAVFEAIDAIINMRGGEANPITIGERLRGSPFDAEKALFPHLTAMFETATLTADAKSLSEVIVTAFRQRQLMGLAENLHAKARGASKPEAVEGMLEEVGSEVFRLSEAGGSKSNARGMRENLIAVIEQAEAARAGNGTVGVPSGFIDLDNLLGGFRKSDLIIVGARPSMGKTSLLLNIAQQAASGTDGVPVGVFSLEMTGEDLTQRMLSNAAKVGSHQLRNGRLSEGDMLRVVKAATELKDLPLITDDTPGLTIGAFRTRARQMKRKHGIQLLIVDYLQLMAAPIRGDYSRVQEISLISRGLKFVARELDIPVIVASQLSRQVDSRENKRPQLSDLRESGTIEQDADVVLMLYREEQYLANALGAADDFGASDADRKRVAETRQHLDAVRGMSEVIVSKHRKGPTGSVKLFFDGATTTFRNFSSQ